VSVLELDVAFVSAPAPVILPENSWSTDEP
jgi:hypothetical protein